MSIEVTQHEPGDVVNGHRLSGDGTAWIPIGLNGVVETSTMLVGGVAPGTHVVTLLDGGDLIVATADGGTVLYAAPAADCTMTHDTVVHETKRTPQWAIVLGVLGIFFFLIGILFFFVKETIATTYSVAVIDTPHGQLRVRTGVAQPSRINAHSLVAPR